MTELTASPNTTSIILGSAAVGALISSIITVVGQVFERRARRRELLLDEAVKIALAHKSFLFEYAKAQHGKVLIPNHAKLVQVYYIAMKHLLLTDTLPKGMFHDEDPEDQRAFRESGRST